MVNLINKLPKPPKPQVQAKWAGVFLQYKKYLKWYIIIGLILAMIAQTQFGFIERVFTFLLFVSIGLIIHGFNGYFQLTKKYPWLFFVIAILMILPAYIKNKFSHHPTIANFKNK